MPVGVVGDVHGNTEALMGVLLLAGAVDALGRKQQGWRLIQLGDGIHGPGEPLVTSFLEGNPLMKEFHRRSAMDARCLDALDELFDELLWGNHEFQFAGGPTFNGGDPQGRTATAGFIRQLHKAGRYKAATSVGNWLITHAGLQPAYWNEYDAHNLDAGELAARLNDDLEAAISTGLDLPPSARPPVFWSLGKRWMGPGRMPPGGIFWADWSELTKGYAELWMDGAPDGALKQIVGHTPQDGPRKTSHYPLVNIDVGGGLVKKACIAVTDDDGATWRTHVFTG